MSDIQESNTPFTPLLALLIQPRYGDGEIPCRRSLWHTIMSWTRAEWQNMMWTSAPFPDPWPGCRCHRCIDSDYLYHVDKLVRLPQSYGFGFINGIHHFQDDLICFKVSGEDVKTREQACYLVAPRNFSSLDPIDEICYQIQRLFWPLRVLLYGKPQALEFTSVARHLGGWLFP